MKENADTFVVLEGHTDNAGDAAYNIQLGQKRNDTVTRFLIVTRGVLMFQVYQASFGEDQPLAPNDSKDGREKNRSVVLRVYQAKERRRSGKVAVEAGKEYKARLKGAVGELLNRANPLLGQGGVAATSIKMSRSLL